MCLQTPSAATDTLTNSMTTGNKAEQQSAYTNMELRASFKEPSAPSIPAFTAKYCVDGTIRILDQQLEKMRLHSYFTPTKKYLHWVAVELMVTFYVQNPRKQLHFSGEIKVNLTSESNSQLRFWTNDTHINWLINNWQIFWIGSISRRTGQQHKCNYPHDADLDVFSFKTCSH